MNGRFSLSGFHVQGIGMIAKQCKSIVKFWGGEKFH